MFAYELEEIAQEEYIKSNVFDELIKNRLFIDNVIIEKIKQAYLLGFQDGISFNILSNKNERINL